jgi:hypothetical protein
MNGVATIERAELLDLHAGGVLLFVLGRGVVLVFALGALELNNFAGHRSTSPQKTLANINLKVKQYERVK